MNETTEAEEGPEKNRRAAEGQKCWDKDNNCDRTHLSYKKTLKEPDSLDIHTLDREQLLL